MKRNIFFITAIVLFAAHALFAQKIVDKPNVQAVKSSAAYAEVLIQKAELTAELENLLLDYTEEYPKIKELRFELGVLQKDIEKLWTVTDAARLTTALGKLIVRRAALATDVWNLQRQYTDEDPNVKRARRKVEVFDKAIKEILP